jgi:sugar phosphate isomerase/epimerase
MSDLTRREFLAAGAGAAAMTRFPSLASPDGIANVGIQLYTVRSLLPKDFDGTLVALRKIGYREVELAGLHGRTAAQFRASLDKAGLTAESAHFALTELRTAWPRIVEDSKVLGNRHIVASWIDAGERKTLSDYQRIAAELNTMGERARGAGHSLAYHNHSYEFEKIDGKLPYDILLNETDKALVAFELDLFWMVQGGMAPRAYLDRHPKRFQMLHVKDRTASGEMVDVGKGTIDFPHIFANAQHAGVQHYFVEHDEPASPLESAKVSFAYMDRVKIPKRGRKG